MIIKIISIDEDNNLAHVCKASDKISCDNEIGQMYVGFFKRIKPILGKTYSMIPQMYWWGGKKLVHGTIANPVALEERKSYKVW